MQALAKTLYKIFLDNDIESVLNSWKDAFSGFSCRVFLVFYLIEPEINGVSRHILLYSIKLQKIKHTFSYKLAKLQRNPADTPYKYEYAEKVFRPIFRNFQENIFTSNMHPDKNSYIYPSAV